MSEMTVLLFALAGLGVSALTTAAVLTQYSGLISMGAELGAGKGYIIIDGRPTDRPALPPAKQPTSPSPVPRDRALGK